MQNRRDQLQAHVFVVGRLVSAMVRAEPDAPETPMRRSTTGTFAGIMLAALAVAGFAVFGLVFPGGAKSWQQPGTIIVQKDTGTRYVLAGGLLRPVLNLASAKLLAGPSGTVALVSAKSLAGVPHGAPIGIPAAPDALPDPAKLSFGPWLICSPTGTDGTGVARPVLTVAVGSIAASSPLPSEQGLLVRAPDGTTYLAWHHTRLRFAGPAAVLALGYGTATPLPVASAWVNALPAGPDLAAQPVPGRGGAGPLVGGTPTRIGQVLSVQAAAGATQFYLVLGDGLAPITRTGAALLLGDPASAAAYPGAAAQAVGISAAAVATAPRSAANPARYAGLPPVPPQLAGADQAGTGVPCVRAVFRSEAAPDLAVALVDTTQAGAATVVAAAGGDPRVPDRVTVPPGGGLIAESVPEPGVAGGTLYLVTDLGVKYPLASAEVAKTLGYPNAAVVPVPAATLAFLPTGPALDPHAATASQPAVGQPAVPTG